MKSIDWYKQTYGGDPQVRVHDKGVMDVPPWLWILCLRHEGVSSKKFRIQKKAVKRAIHKAIIRGAQP